MSEIELENKFKKFRLEEKTLNAKEESLNKPCSCSTNQKNKPSSLLEVSLNKLKIKDRRFGSNLIRPARLKIIGNCYTKKLKVLTDKNDEASVNLVKNIEDFTSEAFLNLRISPATSPDSPSHTITTESQLELDKDERLQASSSLNCSTQAKLQMSSTECDSTIDELSEVLAYHLSLFNHRDKYLIDSMYT